MDTTVRRRPTRPEDFPERGAFALAAIPQRAVARLIDLVLVAIPWMFATLPYLELDGDELRFDGVPMWFPAGQVALAVLYETVAVAMWGRTLGKLALGLQIVRYVDGERPDWSRSLQRTLLPNLAGAIPVAFAPALEAVVYLSALGNTLGRGWHDRASGTLVLRSR